MRRALIALLTVPLLFLVAVGCGSDSPSTSVDKVTVKGQEGKQPKVSFDKPLKATKTRSKVLKPGSGDKVTKGEHVVVNYVGVNGRTAKPFDSSWKNGQPVPFQMDETKTLKGFVKALVGKKVGSRVLMTIPPKDGYGKQGQSQAKIKGTDTLVFVVDVKKAYKPLPHAEGKKVSPPKGLAQVETNKLGEPTGVTVPKGAKPPEKLTTAPLIKGDGAKVAKDSTVTMHYMAVNWRTGKPIFSSWKSQQQGVEPSPVDLPMAQATKVVPGFSGLVGQTVGSRVELVMPLDQAFGQQRPNAKQLKQAGMKKSDKLVFVVDILGAA